MKVVRLRARVAESRASATLGCAAACRTAPLWPLAGRVRPNLCPAIREANATGILLSAPHELCFAGPNDFDVHVSASRASAAGLDVVPGIMGEPGSSALFAKVDTGLSVDDLPAVAVTLPVLDLDLSRELLVPSVRYPLGYSGPIFIPVAARSSATIPRGYPLSQLIWLDSETIEVETSGDLGGVIADAAFEGLLRPGWVETFGRARVVSAAKLLELLSAHSPQGVARILNLEG